MQSTSTKANWVLWSLSTGTKAFFFHNYTKKSTKKKSLVFHNGASTKTEGNIKKQPKKGKKRKKTCYF